MLGFPSQICSMVRDMNVKVRVEAFTALGKISYVSEYILLQTLSKKVLKTIKEKQSVALSSSKSLEINAVIAAGAFIHGLEDEYSEVKVKIWLCSLLDYFMGSLVLIYLNCYIYISIMHL